jgi:hypothetical protein
MQFNRYITEQNITFDDYCYAVDTVFGTNEGVVDVLRDIKNAAVKKIITPIKDELFSIGTDFQIGVGDIVDALKNKSLFDLFKSIGWSLTKLIKSINKFSGLLQQGLLDVFKHLHKTGAFQQTTSGAKKMDEFIIEHPLLAKVTGPAVAGLLFFIWLNMTFIGNMDYDFDFSNIALALAGKYSLEKLFMSPEGLMLLLLFATGGIISAPWLGKATYNLVLAIVYTSVKHSVKHQIPQKAMAVMKNKIPLVKL